MGETGCGKTRMVKFLCDLNCPEDARDTPNMVLLKAGI
jgi:hypothetical protein